MNHVNSRARILINARLWQAGGMETHLLQLCRLLLRKRAEVTLVSRYANDAAPIVSLGVCAAGVSDQRGISNS